MGNCLKCFQTSINTNTAAATTSLSSDQAALEAHSYNFITASSNTTLQNAQLMHTTNTGHVANNTSHSEGRYGAVGVGLGTNNHSRRSFMYGQKSTSQDNEELLASKSPLKFENNCDTKRNSFKKSLVKPVANTDAMSDVLLSDNLHEVSDNALNTLFEAYKDPDVDMILSEGIERLCQDLNYQPDDFAILVLAWCLDAFQMCQFTKAEFIEGLHKISADSIKTIRLRLEHTIDMLKKDMEMFKQLYRFTFRFGLEPDQRILSLEMAISLWKLVFTVHTPEILKSWLHFLEQDPSIRGIPKDTWNMFLNFSEQCDIENYDDTEAWPSLFDDFVDYERLRLAGSTNGATDIKSANDDIVTKGRWMAEKLADDDDDETQDDDNNNDNSTSSSTTVTCTNTTTPPTTTTRTTQTTSTIPTIPQTTDKNIKQEL